MKLIREHLTEYLIYLLSLTFFAGKTYQIVTALVIVSFFVDVIRFKRWYVFKDTLLLSLVCGVPIFLSVHFGLLTPHSP